MNLSSINTGIEGKPHKQVGRLIGSKSLVTELLDVKLHKITERNQSTHHHVSR